MKYYVIILCTGLLFIAGCVHRFTRIEATEIDPAVPPVVVENPLKVFLNNGEILLFPDGARFENNTVLGLVHASSSPGSSLTPLGISLDSVAVMTSYQSIVKQPESFLVSLISSAVTAAGSVVLAKVIFGSCPTIYTEDENEGVLEAELFSNSIVALFEHRDVDRLSIQPDENGQITLELRNEALETHYINHLELLEVAHDREARAIPGPLNEAYVLHDLYSPAKATDITGNDVLDIIAGEDGRAFHSDPGLLAGIDADQLFDHIDLEIPRPASDTIGIYMRLRASLLNTVLFYDHMLATQGANALNWLTVDLNNISTVIEMSEWFRKRMGLRVQVWDGSSFQEVDRVLEVGPIAWDQVAIPIAIPETPEETVKIRLSFIADAWRIDQIAFAEHIREGSYRRIPLAAMFNADRIAQPIAPVLTPDTDYMITSPGERYSLQFDPEVSNDDPDRTFFIAGLGYYTEWVRGDWVREGGNGPRFKASDSTLVAAIEQWRNVRDDFEAQFEATKIPVR